MYVVTLIDGYEIGHNYFCKTLEKVKEICKKYVLCRGKKYEKDYVMPENFFEHCNTWEEVFETSWEQDKSLDEVYYFEPIPWEEDK